MTIMSPKSLFTIGYEQATSQAVLDELRRSEVDLLVDVRAVAASRRPGFSKRQLAAGLDACGIGYLHLQKLGTPKEGREAARSGHSAEMLRIYERHLQKPEPREELDALAAVLQSGRSVCLLCYERDPKACHRSRIAELMCERVDVTTRDLFSAPL